MFYYVSSTYRLIQESKTEPRMILPITIDGDYFRRFLSNLEKELMTSFASISTSRISRSYILSKDFKLSIKVGNLDSKELIYHMLCLCNRLANLNGKLKYIIPKIDNVKTGLNFANSEINFIKNSKDHIDALSQHYLNREYEAGISSKIIKTKGKIRNIKTYSNNHKGRQLRYLHEEILKSFLSVLPSSENSYAYKEGLNPLSCVEKHIGDTYFIKFDVHKYFESILCSRLKAKIIQFIKHQYTERFKKIAGFYNIKSSINDDLSVIINPLFCNYRLPIGFVTSPKVSDFYLYDLDERMKQFNEVTYTRYADDALLSLKDCKKLEEAKQTFIKSLACEGLTINNSKTRKGSLINDGDSFKFLGVNIVRREGGTFEITIGNKYIVETSKRICDCITSMKSHQKNEKEIESLSGRLAYIKSVSKKSFEKVSSLVRLKINDKDKYALYIFGIN